MKQFTTALIQMLVSIFSVFTGTAKLAATTVSVAQDLGDVAKNTSTAYKIEDEVFTQMRINAQDKLKDSIEADDATEDSKKAAFKVYVETIKSIQEAKESISEAKEIEL